MALHAPLLRLPYFWDEAGYYVPAARDLLLTGSPIPHSTVSNAHPPLVMAYLALWWKIAGFAPIVTRTAMLLASSFALLGLFRLAETVANFEVAVTTTILTALYPVFFAQSSLVHLDLAAAGLTFWGLNALHEGQRPGRRALVLARHFDQGDRDSRAACFVRLGTRIARLLAELGRRICPSEDSDTRPGFWCRCFLWRPGTFSITGRPDLFSAIRSFFATTSRPRFSRCEFCSPCWFACGRPPGIFICCC